MLQYDCENEKREEGIQLVGISLFEYGMVIAASDGLLTFFDTDEDGEFVQIRRWKYRSEDFRENPVDVIRGLQVLDTERFKMLSVQLANRNVLLIDMFKEVYQQDKRDDINMKLQEHEAIVNSDEERARLSQQGKLEKDKAMEARELEKEKITAIGYKLIGNGFHAGEITEMHTCL